MTELVERSDTSFSRIEQEITDLKEARYRPYITTMGAFLLVVTGVMTYVYGLETRMTERLFRMTQQIAITGQKMESIDQRLSLRTQQMVTRWGVHDSEHKRIDGSNATLVNRLLETGALDSTGVRREPEGE